MLKNVLKPLFTVIEKPMLIKNYKIYFLILFMFLFSLIYLVLDDSNFSGVNKYSQAVREQVVKNLVKKELVEPFVNEEKELQTDLEYIPYDPALTITAKEEDAIQETTEEAKKDVIKTDITVESLKPSLSQKLYNRLYFSINTGCLLGYGDVYPTTNLCKLLTMIQSLSTVGLILA